MKEIAATVPSSIYADKLPAPLIAPFAKLESTK